MSLCPKCGAEIDPHQNICSGCLSQPCGTCGGTGAVDSGGVNPDMSPISVSCHCSEWRADSSLEKWFPFTAVEMQVLEWLKAGKYRTIQHRHDGSYRLKDEALNIEANGDSLQSIVLCEFWPKFRDCTERAP